MDFNLNKLRKHSIQPTVEETLPGKDSSAGEGLHQRPDPKPVPIVAPPVPPLPQIKPVDRSEELNDDLVDELDDELNDDLDIESALAADLAESAAQSAAQSGQPVSKSPPVVSGWGGRQPTVSDELRNKSSLPEVGQASNVLQARRPWDSRESFFGDFYGDPRLWPLDLIEEVRRLYCDGTAIVTILHRVARPRRPGETLSVFNQDHLGPVRIMDIYAVLYTMSLIPQGRAFPNDPRYTPFGLHTVRNPIVDTNDKKRTEIPLCLFPIAYAKLACYGGYQFKRIAAELMREYPAIEPIQLQYTLKHQIYKACKRRLLSMRKSQPHLVNQHEAALAFFRCARNTGIVLKHREQMFVLMEWPEQTICPVDAAPTKPVEMVKLAAAVRSLKLTQQPPGYAVLQNISLALAADKSVIASGESDSEEADSEEADRGEMSGSGEEVASKAD